MKFGISTLAVALLLSGCASAFDASAVEANVQERAQCNKAWALQDTIKTYAAFGECYLASDEALAKKANPQKMAVFNSYAASIRLMSANADAGKISSSEWVNRTRAAHDSLSYSFGPVLDNSANNAAVANFLVGATAAFATGYAQGQAAQANHAPVMTTCTTAGTMTNCLSN